MSERRICTTAGCEGRAWEGPMCYECRDKTLRGLIQPHYSELDGGKDFSRGGRNTDRHRHGKDVGSGA